jgi:transcriptional regulator with XRE-family HTH domain
MDVENDIIQKIRDRIKLFRTAEKISLTELGRRINKARSTVWKYENGGIRLELDVLLEIAKALNIEREQLILPLFSKYKSDSEEKTAAHLRNYYMYSFDENIKQFIISVIQIGFSDNGKKHSCSLFCNIDAFDKPDTCRGLYLGQVTVERLHWNFALRNKFNSFEHFFMITKESFNQPEIHTGMLLAISYENYQPMCCKVIVSEKELNDFDRISLFLKMGKDDLLDAKKNNFFRLKEIPNEGRLY